MPDTYELIQRDPSGPPSDALLLRSFVLRAVREQAREADFVCSTDALDSYGEIVAQNWDLTSRYASNPVVLYAHNAHSAMPIGQGRNVRVQDGALHATIYFSKVTTLAEEVWQQVLEKTLRAVSVGFKSKTIRYERIDDKDVYVLDDNVLYEISVCPIGANPEALAKSHEEHERRKSAARSQWEQTARSIPAPTPPAAHSGAPTTAKEHHAMDPKDIEIAALKTKTAERDGEIAVARAKVAELEKSLDAERVNVKTLEAQNTHLVGERDAAKAAHAKAEDELILLQITDLVGKKIDPTEVEQFVELRKTNPKLCERMLAQRSDKNLIGVVIPSAKNEAPTPPVAADTGASDWATFQKSLD